MIIIYSYIECICDRRIGPNAKPLETQSKKTDVKNDASSSKLVIRDLQLSDSGIYKLTVHNGVKSKEIYVSLFVEGMHKK